MIEKPIHEDITYDEIDENMDNLFVKPVSRRSTAFVIEFKISDSAKALAEKAKEALQQIEDRMYESELRDDGYDSIACYGIAFCGKDCEVEIKGYISHPCQFL